MSDVPKGVETVGRELAPAIFSDGILNVAISRGVVKLYLFRNDPFPDEPAGAENTVVAQIIMPVEAFAATAVFFQERLEFLVKSEIIGQDQVDRLRAKASE